MNRNRGVAPVVGLIVISTTVVMITALISIIVFSGANPSAYSAQVTTEQMTSDDGINQIRVTVQSFGDADKIVINQTRNGFYSAELTPESENNFVTIGDGINDVYANETNDGDPFGVLTAEVYEIYAVKDGEQRLVTRIET